MAFTEDARPAIGFLKDTIIQAAWADDKDGVPVYFDTWDDYFDLITCCFDTCQNAPEDDFSEDPRPS